MTRRRILSIIANVTGAVMDTDKAEALIGPMLSDHHPRCRASDKGGHGDQAGNAERES
jgi:hypothetical protein